MLTIYRRHKETCPNFTRARYAKGPICKCKWWADGVLDGKEVRFSLETRDEKEAKNKQHALENGLLIWTKEQGIIPKPGESTESAEKLVTLSDAWKAKIAELQANGLSDQTIRKYKLLERQMTVYGEKNGLTVLCQFDLDTLSKFRQTWKDGPRTASKKIERLRAFFRFAHDRNWCDSNPAAKITLPKAKPCPTMPLTDSEWVKLLTACDKLQLSAQPSARLGARRLNALVLLMRYSGLRISDAVSLTTDRLDGKRLFLYTQKTGTAVYTVLPDFVLKALEETPRVTEKNYFWSGNGKRETAVCDYQERIKNLFAAAGIVKGLSNAVSHRLRDTFATGLLQAGVPMDRVAVLLGNSVQVCEKHYSAWTDKRQKQLESDLASAWELEIVTEKGGTNPVQLAKGPVN